MIKETIDQNAGNSKAMLSKFVKRTRKAAVQKRGRAIKFAQDKITKLKRKRKALMRLAWEEKKKLADRNSKF